MPKLIDFDFELPQELIANEPANPRDSSRLLFFNQMTDHIFNELPNLLQADDILVFNDAKVIPARLYAHTPTGAKVEILLNRCMGGKLWEIMAKPARKLKIASEIQFSDELQAIITAKGEGGFHQIEFVQNDYMPHIIAIGEMPLPPYIKREAAENDKRDYQTIYAKNLGAVAAPTAGLHFTEELFHKLDAKGIERLFVTLHVGAGTFLPVKSDNIQEHIMHKEYGEISEEVAQKIREAKSQGRRIIAVGTTSLRILETAAKDGEIKAFCGDTDIFITPPYQFHAIDGLITNFHLPKSTLFMLICALIGIDEARAAYFHAIKSNYRFFSYGDACLIFNPMLGVE